MSIISSPTEVIRKSYLRQKLVESEFKNFKQSLLSFLDDLKDNDEEYNKTLLKELLEKSIGYSTYKINTKDKIDLAIYIDNTPEIIIELKAPKNKSEMITVDNLNKKALHETLLYYLREKHKNKNFNLKHIVITNSIEWFVFDAVEFNKISTNKKIEKIYKDKEIYETLFSANNDEFYRIVEDILKDETILKNIKYTRFYLKDKQTDTQLKNIYKLLSPTHLLKLYNDNDSNSLNKNFYYELLHILGLEETKDGGKKIIGRKNETNREDGSLLENTILKLSTTHGVEEENKLFEIALELNITWLNRILFLKLLEARLLNIHNGKYPKFSTYDVVNEFDKLDTLFFEVLAKKIDDRNTVKIEQFKNIPYLNSSLFEPTELERKYLFIGNLKNDSSLKKYSKTVLKTESKELSSVEYLFNFLNAYDFGSDDVYEFKKEHSTLINSSVLGLIFEKLNGYKDGSFFTPAFITIHMTKQSIRKTVVDKFNKEFDWNCKTIADVYNKDYDLNKANELLNSVTICDPAVGSGHFLVSSLNELLSIKSELDMLIDENGKRLKNIKLIAEDDEIYILDEDGEFFEYKLNDGFKVSDEIIRIQKTIFNEKLHIIENQLFGVDININSVKITQLRLWIELLKDSYYDENNELVTLPNIDINIKCGNSLISKYSLQDSDTKNKFLIEKLDDYKKFVSSYKTENNKNLKKELKEKINNLKKDFSEGFSEYSPRMVKFKKNIKSYVNEYNYNGLNDKLILIAIKNNYHQQNSLFTEDKLIKTIEKTRKNFLKKLTNMYEIINDLQNAEIYENSFEWRFEFPEVLNDDGEFVGFDVIVGNPPYVQLSKVKNISNHYKKYLKERYSTSAGRLNTFIFFIHLSIDILKDNGNLSFIIPNTILTQDYYSYTRMLLVNNVCLNNLIEFDKMPFEDATVETVIIEYEKKIKQDYIVKQGILTELGYTEKQQYQVSEIRNNHNFSFLVNGSSIIKKVFTMKNIPFNLLCNINQGIALKGDKELSIVHENNENKYYKLLDGRNINQYSTTWDGVYLDYDVDKIHSCKRQDIFEENQKLLFRRVSSSLIFTYDDSKYYALNTLVVVTVKDKQETSKLKFILALMNSKLMNYIYVNKFKSKKKVFSEIQATSIGLLPIPLVGIEIQDEFIEIVDNILELKKEGKDTSELECSIDKKMYALYELDDEEIAMVEKYDKN